MSTPDITHAVTPAKRTFKEGDKVSYTRTTTSGSRMSFSSREGTVEKVHSTTVTIKLRNGRRELMGISSLRHLNEKSELTETFEEMAKSVGITPA